MIGGKNRFLSKLPKNGHFLLNKVPKITNNKKFQKSENAQNIWFSHRFSISAQKVTPKGLPDGLAHLGVGMASAHWN